MKSNVRFMIVSVTLISAVALEASPLVPTGGPALNRPTNLVLNGSFEDNYAGQHYWATGTTLTPYSAIPNWTGQGGTAAYAVRTNTAGYAPGYHGNALLYFGNSFISSVSTTPTFNPNGSVTFASPPTIVPQNANYTPAVTLKQVVTGLTPGYTYGLSFWVSGEAATSVGYGHDGVFGLDVTGYNTTYLACPDAPANSIFGTNNHTYRFDFVATAASTEIKFTNWGHFIYNTGGPWVVCTELVLDDVILNLVKAPEPGSLGLLALGSVGLLRRRRK